MPRIYTDLQFRNQSSYTTSTSSSEFDSFGDRLVSSINMEEIQDQEWKHFPFFVQKICGVRIVITSTNANISSTTTYNAVISKHQTEPTIGLTLSKVSRNDKLLTNDNFTVPYVHIQSIQLQDQISHNTIKVFEEDVPLQRMPVLKTAYDQEYLTSVFGRDHLNPMLVYDDQPLPFTPDNRIDISYLQQVYDLGPQTFGFQTWIRQMGIYNFAKNNNYEYSSSQLLDQEDFQALDSARQEKLFVSWQYSFPQHCLSFHHWFEFYMKKHPSQKIRTPESKVDNEANEVEDWDVTTSVFLPPLSSSPKIHTTDLYLQENSMNLPAPDNAKLVQLQQQPQNSKKLEDVAIDISDVIYSAKIWEKAGIASLVNGYSYTEIRPKLLFKGQNNFTSFSDYIKDIALDEFFYEEVATEFDIFKFDYKTAKPLQEQQLETFCVDKRFSELQISPEDFLPSGKLADVYIPNYAYLPINAIEALNITSDRPNGDIISNEDRFYVWARLRSARRKAIELTHWDQKALLPFTRISPYGLWTTLTKSTSTDNAYVIDYYQHIAAELSAEKKNLSSTLHFYDMFIRPLECFFACNTPFGDMLLQSRDHLSKSTKIVQIALRLTNRSYAPPTLDYAFIYEELTKIRHLTYSNLRTHFQEDLSPPSRLQRLFWPLSPSNEEPDCPTFEATSRFEQKARQILADQREKVLLFVDQYESWPFYDMFPEHGGIFMNLELKKQLYRISTSFHDSKKLHLKIPLPSKTKPKNSVASSSSFMSEEEEEPQQREELLCLTIDYGTVSQEHATNRIKIQEARNPDRRIQGIFFPTILPVVPQKNIDLSDLHWMKHRSTSPPAWASQHHSAYTFAKIFTPNFANKIRHAHSKTSHIFPADDLDFKRTIEIRNHLELRSANEKKGEQIIKISETRSGFHSQDRTSMCIYIHRRTLEKLLSACVRALNLVLIPINDENDTEYTCFDSKTVADEEAELNYVIDIAKPTPKSKNVRMIHIFMETMFNDIIVGSIDIPWHQFDIFTRELQMFLQTPGFPATFY